MRKLVILFAFILGVFTVSAQLNGNVQTITADTLTAVETEYFVVGPLGANYEKVTIQALHTQLGGTSDGSGILQKSVDGVSYVTVQDATGVMNSFPNDSSTITNGAVYIWELTNPGGYYYRYAATGTASDTTLVSVKWIPKK